MDNNSLVDYVTRSVSTITVGIVAALLALYFTVGWPTSTEAWVFLTALMTTTTIFETSYERTITISDGERNEIENNT